MRREPAIAKGESGRAIKVIMEKRTQKENGKMDSLSPFLFASEKDWETFW